MLIGMAVPEYRPEQRSATMTLRTHWGHLRKAVTQAERMLDRLPEISRQQRETELYTLDQFLVEGIGDHLSAEECALFPVADQLEPGELPITVTLRAENRRLRALIGEFHRLATEAHEDVAAARQVGRDIMRRLLAHFDQEERLLFSYLDERLTLDEVEALLAGPMLDHNYGVGPTEHHVSSHHMSKFHRPSPET